MKKTMIAATMAMGLVSATVALPARADSHDRDMNFEMIFKLADKNKDSMVTKAEFLEAMGKAYDMKMAKMKTAKDDKMMKGDAMTRDGVKALVADIYRGA